MKLSTHSPQLQLLVLFFLPRTLTNHNKELPVRCINTKCITIVNLFTPDHSLLCVTSHVIEFNEDNPTSAKCQPPRTDLCDAQHSTHTTRFECWQQCITVRCHRGDDDDDCCSSLLDPSNNLSWSQLSSAQLLDLAPHTSIAVQHTATEILLYLIF